MKMKGADMWIGMTVLAVAVSLLAIPTSHAQKAAGISRVGWLEVCGPGPRRPNLEIFRGRLAELGYVVMFLHDPQAAPNAWKLTQEAAPRLGITLEQAQVGAAEELLPELTVIEKERPDALFVYPDVVLSSYPRPQQLAEFALNARLPMMNAFRFFADAGGLMTYGATASEIYKSAAEQVAKVLGGARPSELPLREATRFELVINNWTAKALGITIPPSLLVRADEVIESAPPFATH